LIFAQNSENLAPFTQRLRYNDKKEFRLIKHQINNTMTQAQLPKSVTTSAKSLKAISNLFLALFAISFAPIFIRFSAIELNADATVFNRSLIFLLIFGVGRSFNILFSQSKPNIITKKSSYSEWILLIIMGILSVITLGLWTYSLQYITIAKSMLLTNITPLFTALGSWLLFNKHFDYKFLLGMAISLSGVIFLGVDDLKLETSCLIGDLCAILSAVFRGGYFLIVEKLREYCDGTTILIWRCIISCLILLPIILNDGQQLFPQSSTVWLAVIGLGLISEGIGQRLLADSLNQFSSSFVALFLLLEPIISAVLGWLIFSETINFVTKISFIFILGGIYLAKSSEASVHHSN